MLVYFTRIVTADILDPTSVAPAVEGADAAVVADRQVRRSVGSIDQSAAESALMRGRILRRQRVVGFPAMGALTRGARQRQLPNAERGFTPQRPTHK
jgi:hypothetical protein